MDQWADAVVPKDHFVRRFAWAGLGWAAGQWIELTKGSKGEKKK